MEDYDTSTDVNFKRLVGVTRDVFLKMVEVIKCTTPKSTQPQKSKKRGVKPKLNNYDKVLLMYYREYRPFVHIGATTISMKHSAGVLLQILRNV